MGCEPTPRGSEGLIRAACMGVSCRGEVAAGNAAAHSSTAAPGRGGNCVTLPGRSRGVRLKSIAKVSVENPLNPTTPKSKPPLPQPPLGVKLPPGTVRHDEHGKGMLNWAAVTARHIALSASQVLRKLDHRGLSIEDTNAPRGRSSARVNQMPGGGMNPYESGPKTQSRHAPKHSTVIKGAGAAQSARARPTSRASVRARPSWWQRLFRRG
jgi:hypothetical protein